MIAVIRGCKIGKIRDISEKIEGNPAKFTNLSKIGRI